MTYKEAVLSIKAAAETLSATFYYGSVLRLNEWRDVKYPVIVLSPRTNSMSGSTISYGFTLWCVDIQGRDRRDALDIQSRAIDILQGMGNRLVDADLDATILMGVASVFAERFADIDAGAMCDLTIAAAAPPCPPEIISYE